MFIPLNIIQFHKCYILTALTLIWTSVLGTYLLATMNQNLSEDEAAVKSEVVLIISTWYVFQVQWCAGRFYYFLKGVVSDLSCPLILLGTEVSTWRHIWIKWPGNAPLWLSLTLATCCTKAPASQLFGQFAGGLHENKRSCQRKYKFNFRRKYLH